MCMDFTDERLSAYLDGELPAHEQAAFEQLLADRPEQQQALVELTVLRSDLQQLPQHSLGDDFTNRVVAAAIAAKAEADASLNLPAPPRRRNAWKTPWVALPAIAAALLVALLVVQRQWQDSEHPGPRAHLEPGQVAITPNALAELRRVSPGPDDVVVVRIRISKAALVQSGVESALVKSGIELGRANQSADAQRAGSNYRRQVRRQLAGGPSNVAGVASEALFIEAPLEQVEATLAELGRQPSSQSDFRLEMIVSTKVPASEQAEGEGGSRIAQPVAAPTGPVAHRLDAQGFQLLPDAPANDLRTSQLHAPTDAKRPVRVLMLIEATE